MHDGRNKVMRRGLNRSMTVIGNVVPIEYPSDLDFGQCQSVQLQYPMFHRGSSCNA